MVKSSWCWLLAMLPISRALRMPAISTKLIHSSKLNCVGTELTPLFPTDDNTNELYVHSLPTTIVPVAKQLPLPRPTLITFDATGTLIKPSQSIGRWYREILNTQCDMRIRLPRPALFTTAFTKAYADRSKAYPCFGAKNGLSPREWWAEVVKQTFKTTETLTVLEPEELEQLLPGLCEALYVDVFSTSKGWSVSDDAVYTLEKLRGWRDEGAGPKLGVISNFDDRLHTILQDLDLAKYFDLIYTSYEKKSEKPDRGMFDMALDATTTALPGTSYHIGDNIDKDVAGAVAAGWTGMRFREWFDEDLPDWSAIESEAEADQGAAKRQQLMLWGRRDTQTGLEWVELWGLDDVLTVFGFPDDDTKPLRTTYIRGFLDD